MARFWPIAVVVVALLAGCSADHPAPIRTPPPATSSALPYASPTPRAEPTSTSGPRFQMPLAFIVQATRPVADVPVAGARLVVAKGGTRWSGIGQPGGRMRVLIAKAGGAASVIRAVRASRDVLGIVPAEAVDPTVRVLTVGGRHPLRDPGPIRSRRPRLARAGESPRWPQSAMSCWGAGWAVAFANDPSAPVRPLSRRLAEADITVGQFRVDAVHRRFADPGR